jgi:hypothetical protein
METVSPGYHLDAVRRFDAAEDASQDARVEAEKARDYYDGRQLDEAQIAALKKRKQPIVIENLIGPKVDYLCGLERQSRTDPKAYPRTAKHSQDADAATDAIRFVSDVEDYPIKRSAVFQHLLVEGYGAVEIGAEERRGQIDPTIKLIDWDRLYYDPHSCRPDFSDAYYLGYVTWMDLDDAKRTWPDKADILEATFNAGASSVDETYDDKPKWKSWVEPRRRRVRICTEYCRQSGQWMRSVFTLSGELEEAAPSPFLDDEGRPECALIFQSAYVDRDNDRYGIVRRYITLQDEVNKRRSKFLHLANSRPLRVDPASGMSAEQARAEFNRPDGVLVAGQGEIEDLTSLNMASGHFSLLAEAKEAINAVGPNAAMQGREGAGQSGRAILALQQGGMVEMAPLLDALRHFNIRVYRAIWNRIRQFWTSERWVRVTDEEANVRFVGLNTTRGNIALMKLKTALEEGELDKQTAQQYAMQIQQDPSMMLPANPVAEIEIDIELDEVQDTVTAQFEQFDQLATMLPSFIQARPDRAAQFVQLMVEASSLRGKDKLRDILADPEPNPEQQQMAAMMQQMQAMMAQLEMSAKQAEIEKTQSETAENVAQAEAIAARTGLEAFKTGAGLAV